MFRRIQLGVVAAVITCAAIDGALAQTSPARATVACKPFLFEDAPRTQAPDDTLRRNAAQTLASCLGDIVARADSLVAMLRANAKLTAQQIPADATLLAGVKKLGIDPYLILEHSDFKTLREWAKAALADPTLSNSQRLELETAVAEADRAIHAGLEAHGLNQAFSAALRTGAVVGNSKKAVGGSSEQTEKIASTLAWESKYLGAESHSFFTFSLNGKLGFMPALMLVAPQSSSNSSLRIADSTTTAQGTYQEAFVWDISPRLNFAPLRQHHASQLSLYARIGQVTIGTESTLIDNGAQSVLAVPIANNTAKAEMFFEGGIEFKIFNNPLEVIRAEGSSSSPVFATSIAIRRDNRFRKDGALAAFDTPDRRGVFSFMIDALQVVDKRDVAAAPRTFTFGFGVEREFSLARSSGTAKVPSGTKLSFRGDIDMLRLIQGK